MTSRPAAPESPETDALLMQHLSPRSKWFGLGRESYREAAVRQVGALIEHARSLERRLSLAQTEIKGHMRIEDDLKRDISIYQASIEKFAMQHQRKVMGLEARIAELEKDAARVDWLHRQLKMTIAHALHWPYTPQDGVSFRTKIDKAIKEDHA